MPYRFRNRKFSNITILSPPHSGRYSDGTAKLTLCEVEIYAGKIAYYELAIRYYRNLYDTTYVTLPPTVLILILV